MAENNFSENDFGSFSGKGFGGLNNSKEYRKYQESEKEAEGGFYERLARKFGRIAKVDLKKLGLKGKAEKITENIELSRMNVSQQEIGALLLIPFIFLFPIALIVSLLAPLPIALFSWAVVIFWCYWVLSYPDFKATITKIKSSDEALKIILYLAMYLDMNPNLEGAIKTAAEHSEGPLSKDFNKILWDTQTNKYSSIQQGIADHMKLWRKWSPEFVKSLEFLIDSTTQHEKGRKRLIKKAQDNIIESTKNKMSQFARDLSSPVKVIHMAGIVLPLMGLIMFPMITVFMGDETTSVGLVSLYLSFGYIVLLPSFLFFLVKRLISKRPGAYSAPSLNNVKGIPPSDKFVFNIKDKTYTLSIKFVAALVALIVMLPGIFYYGELGLQIVERDTELTVTGGGSLSDMASDDWESFISSRYDERCFTNDEGVEIFCYGNLVVNVIQGMTIFWGLAAGLVVLFLGRGVRQKKVRERINEIDDGIDVALTELENSLSKSLPIERAVSQTLNKMDQIGESDHPIFEFFQGVLNRMQTMKLGFEAAIFDDEKGAIHYYPSNLLKNSMKVIANTIKRGSRSTAKSIRSVNEYILNHRRVEEVIKSLLDEVVSQMKMLGNFIAPIITSIAGVMALMIVGILVEMGEELGGAENGGSAAIEGVVGDVAMLHSVNNAVPPTLTLLIISLYLLTVMLILGYFTSGIEFGFDRINMDISIAKTIITGTVVFTLIVLSGSVILPQFISQMA